MLVDPNPRPDEDGNITVYGYIVIKNANPNLSFLTAFGCALTELLQPIIGPILFMWSWVRRKPVQLFKVKVGKVPYKQYLDAKRQQEEAEAQAKKANSPIVQP